MEELQAGRPLTFDPTAVCVCVCWTWSDAQKQDKMTTIVVVKAMMELSVMEWRPLLVAKVNCSSSGSCCSCGECSVAGNQPITRFKNNCFEKTKTSIH